MSIRKLYDYMNIALIQADKAGNILFVNEEAKKVLLMQSKSILTNLDQIYKFFDKSVIKNEIIVLNDGVEKTFNITMFKEEEYEFVILKDITLEKSLSIENAILKEVIEHISEGVQISDKKDVMVLYNKSCERIEGIDRESCLGKKSSEVYIETKNTEKNSIHRIVLKSGIPVIDKYNQYNTIEGKTVNVITSTYPYYRDGKPVAIYSIIKDITKLKEATQKNIHLQKQLIKNQNPSVFSNGTHFNFNNILGEDKKFKDVIETAKKVSVKNSTVLIYGETGTGKELFAQSIHNEGLSMSGPFVAINCAAIPESLLEGILFGTVIGAFTNATNSQGIFEQAENGTLFLDEINSMGINLQAKLLRVLQEKTIRRIGDKVEKKINCRIISSVNKDPIECIKNNEMRADLYYRLSGITLYIPPLRERRTDIIIFIIYYINRFNSRYKTKVEHISKDLKHALMNYDWPGNIRELEHVVESCMNIVDMESDTISVHTLPLYLIKRFSIKENLDKEEFENLNKEKFKDLKTLEEILEEVEKQVIVVNLKKNKGNVSKTARGLGLIRQSLQYRIRKFGIRNDSI